jgi:hypothetical protein
VEFTNGLDVMREIINNYLHIHVMSQIITQYSGEGGSNDEAKELNS